jgi:hypothetical protein
MGLDRQSLGRGSNDGSWRSCPAPKHIARRHQPNACLSWVSELERDPSCIRKQLSDGRGHSPVTHRGWTAWLGREDSNLARCARWRRTSIVWIGTKSRQVLPSERRSSGPVPGSQQGCVRGRWTRGPPAALKKPRILRSTKLRLLASAPPVNSWPDPSCGKGAYLIEDNRRLPPSVA